MQKVAKKSPSGHHRTILSGYILQLNHISTIGKKELVKQQYLLHMSPQYMYSELRLTSGWDRYGSLGRTNFGRRAFTVAGPTAWNSLPDYLRDPSLSENTFRRLL